MKIGVMQPYFVPYIGYWQLINAVDKYVIFDDVNFIKRGWINRNRILVAGEPHYLNISMLGMSQNKLINQIEINQDQALLEKNLRTIQWEYKKAPFYNTIYPLIEKIFKCKKKNVVDYIMNSLFVICDYLEMNTDFVISSSLEKNNQLKGQEKIIEICEILGASEYYNAIGGQDLYSFSAFDSKNIKLLFLKTNKIEYHQFENKFQPNLSIIDVLMFNSKEQVKKFLDEYTLV